MISMRRFALACLALCACERPARIALDPPRLQLFTRGGSAKVHASVFAKNGRPLPQEVCAWSSSDEKVVAVKGRHNEATVTAVGSGSAAVRCRIGDLASEAPVSVRWVARLEAEPRIAELKMLDEPRPVVLEVRAFDGDGHLLSGRTVHTRCIDENVCRGDDRGQLWAVGPGRSGVVVLVDEARVEVEARVVDARTAEGKPRRVKGNPMEIYEKAVKAMGK
jgi:hypothetical protein